MKTETAIWRCTAAMAGLLTITPSIFGEEIPEFSSPARKGSTEYPETIAGAPFSDGVSMESPEKSGHTEKWKLPVAGPYRRVKVKATVKSPAPGNWNTWDPLIALKVSPEEDFCEATWEIYPCNGWIEGTFTVESCDARGWYKLDVYFDGVLKAEIPFEVK